MNKLIFALAFASSVSQFGGSFFQMAVAQEIETTFSDTDVAEMQNTICSVVISTISDETAIGNPLQPDGSGGYTYTREETHYVTSSGDDDDDGYSGGGYYEIRNVTVTLDSTDIDSTIQDNLPTLSVQDEVNNICNE